MNELPGAFEAGEPMGQDWDARLINKHTSPMTWECRDHGQFQDDAGDCPQCSEREEQP